MASYKIEWKKSAKKELKKLDKQIIIRILQAVEKLATNPHPLGSKNSKLKLYNGLIQISKTLKIKFFGVEI